MKLSQLFLILTAAFVIQTAHFTEHVAQLVQIYGLGMAPPIARGLLGSIFDFEWVHFGYNVGLEVILIGLWLTYRRARQGEHAAAIGDAMPVLTGLVLFQGYHSVEHFAKLYQYLFIPLYWMGVPTPGILPQLTGWPIFLVHFVFNLVVWGTMGLAVGKLSSTALQRKQIAAQG